MTRYLLDTNILTVLEDQEKPGYSKVVEQIKSLAENDQVMISVLSVFELQHGIAKSPPSISSKLKSALESLLHHFPVVTLSVDIAAHYGNLKAIYEYHYGIKKPESQRHTIDFILAATALEKDAVLVSADGIFSKILDANPLLKLENWT